MPAPTPRSPNPFTDNAAIITKVTKSVDKKKIFKRLIVCCDGTWKSSDQAEPHSNYPTNVTRFCRAIEMAEHVNDDLEIQQVVYYQAGIGTGAMSSVQKYVAGMWRLHFFR
jgi:uncharacterized protein (DUF2235 family)